LVFLVKKKVKGVVRKCRGDKCSIQNLMLDGEKKIIVVLKI